MKCESKIVVAAALMFWGVSGTQADILGTGENVFNIDFVTISGNTNPSSAYGTVGNDYRMGTFEITNGQWDKFVASLGIPVTGNPLHAYDENPYFIGPNLPNNATSWYEAAQFTNWLNTSTGHQAAYKFTGTPGQSNYTLTAWSSSEGDNGTNFYRHKDAKYYLPTEDEWVKAAYWNGNTLQTYSNAFPDNLVSGTPDPAKWNYGPTVGTGPWNVGSGTKELNGTYDMMGNVSEWMESPYNDPAYEIGSDRVFRGGSYGGTAFNLSSSYRWGTGPEGESGSVGFRVAADVPEPASLSLLALGSIGIFGRR